MTMLHCPRCRSTELFAIAGGYLGSVYRCKHCGYQGAFVVEYDDEPACRGDREEDHRPRHPDRSHGEERG